MNTAGGKVVAMVTGIAAVVVTLAIFWQPNEPSYRGKQLSYWLKEIGSPDRDSKRAAGIALGAMGPKGVGFFAHAIDRQTSILYPQYRTVWLKLPAIVERMLPRPESRSEVLNNSFLALTLIGPPAIPVLVKQLHSGDEEVRFYATLSLAAMGRPAIPALIVQLQGRDARKRQLATRTLGLMGAAAEGAGPDLARLLQDPSADVRAEADLTLKAAAPEAYDDRIRLLTRVAEEARRIQVPRRYWDYRIGLSHQTGSEASIPIAELLLVLQTPYPPGQSVDAASAVIVPTLVRRLGDANEAVRSRAAAALNRIKWSPLADLTFRPAVMEQLGSTNPVARQEAAFAYWRREGSGFMIETLIKELQNAPDLETGQRLLHHFSEMGDAIKPSIPLISNVVTGSVQLRSLSNQVSRLNGAF